MAKIDGKIYLVMFWNVDDWLLVLHVNGHELVTDLRSMLCIINQTKLFVGYIIFHFWIVFQFDALTLDFLSPAILVEALSEENNVR